MIVGVTGHRPHKLWGYDDSKRQYKILQSIFRAELERLNVSDAWSGMALGTDVFFALEVLRMRAADRAIKLHCAIPCVGQEKKWPTRSQDIYNFCLEYAESKCYISKEYSAYAMQKRNEYIVDHVNKLIAVYDGSTGGTKNCIDYAERVGIPIMFIHPTQVDEIYEMQQCTMFNNFTLDVKLNKCNCSDCVSGDLCGLGIVQKQTLDAYEAAKFDGNSLAIDWLDGMEE